MFKVRMKGVPKNLRQIQWFCWSNGITLVNTNETADYIPAHLAFTLARMFHKGGGEPELKEYGDDSFS